jgi:hypothetical protein
VYNALVIKDTGKDGSPLRTIFMIDPATSLPAHGEQERQVGGRWKSEGFIHFEFNTRIDPSLLKSS